MTLTEIRDDSIYSIGLGLAGLKKMVQEGKKVVALKHKVVNILITDHITAQYLIRKAQVT